jgi:DNA-binding Xre family transcriptional regulator
MKKQDLMEVAGIAPATVSKLQKGENLNTNILLKICNALQCTSDDIIEILPDAPKLIKNKGFPEHQVGKKWRFDIQEVDQWVKEQNNDDTIANYIQPIKQGGTRLNIENLQSLCRACHNRKHLKEK